MTILPVNGNGWCSCGMYHRPGDLAFLNLHNRFVFGCVPLCCVGEGVRKIKSSIIIVLYGNTE